MSAVEVSRLRKEFVRRRRSPVVALDGITFSIARGVVAIPVGLAVFRAGERYAKRHGKLKRSG
jgi:hypothetical protein